MIINRELLVKDLSEKTMINIKKAEEFIKLEPLQLNWKEHEKKWSILECLEHLNLYSKFYLPEIERVLYKRNKDASEEFFRSGWLGNFLANQMLPTKNTIKMKAFKSKDPAGSKLDMSTVHQFMNDQIKMLDLFARMKNVNLTKTKTATTIPFLKLRLGDTLRFITYHNMRHLAQAQKVMEMQNLHQKILL